MKQVTIRINFDVENSAFRDIDNEVSIPAVKSHIERTARKLVQKVEENQYGSTTFKLYDLNGNTVGRATINIPKELPNYR